MKAIRRQDTRASLRFVVRVAGAAAAIFIAYNVLLLVVRPQTTPSSDAGMRNRVVAERYWDGKVPPAVVVGTSLAFRLSPDFLLADALGPAIYNLALGGGSAATGLEILAGKATLPRLVLVEANLGYLPPDHALLRELVAEGLIQRDWRGNGVRKVRRPRGWVVWGLERRLRCFLGP